MSTETSPTTPAQHASTPQSKHIQGLLYVKIYGAVDVPVDTDESKAKELIFLKWKVD